MTKPWKVCGCCRFMRCVIIAFLNSSGSRKWRTEASDTFRETRRVAFFMKRESMSHFVSFHQNMEERNREAQTAGNVIMLLWTSWPKTEFCHLVEEIHKIYCTQRRNYEREQESRLLCLFEISSIHRFDGFMLCLKIYFNSNWWRHVRGLHPAGAVLWGDPY